MMGMWSLPFWIYLLAVAAVVGGAVKKIPPLHLSAVPSVAAWLGATLLLERLWTLCPSTGVLLTALLGLTFCLCSTRRTCLRASLLPARGKAVFITGCDSGFGKAAAQHLDALGFQVFATVLDLSGGGARELQRTCSSHLTLLQVDITQPQQVQQAVLDTKAKLGLSGLWALVNNAGVCVNFGDAELSLMSNYRGCMEVNFFGTLNITKSFLPLLRRSRGRIVTISSPAGDQPFPCLAAYGASKAALNLFTNTLRHELEPWGVSVCTILPSSYKTGRSSNRWYWEQQHQQLLQALPAGLLEDYGEDYVTETKELFQSYAGQADPDLSPVTRAIVQALLAPRPRRRYFAGPGVGLMYFLSTYCPASVSSRFLQRVFMKKTLLPRALRRPPGPEPGPEPGPNNNNNNEEKVQ